MESQRERFSDIAVRLLAEKLAEGKGLVVDDLVSQIKFSRGEFRQDAERPWYLERGFGGFIVGVYDFRSSAAGLARLAYREDVTNIQRLGPNFGDTKVLGWRYIYGDYGCIFYEGLSPDLFRGILKGGRAA